MSLNQSLYFMSLVGGMAGLFSWALATLLISLIGTQQSTLLSDWLASVILGGFIGGLTVGFSDRWSGNRVLARWIISGLLIGILAGLVAGLVEIPITRKLEDAYPLFARVLTWTITGAFIGFGLGLRWFSVNRLRPAHALVGGLIGGAVGGTLFGTLRGPIPELSLALGFVLVGIGITVGVTLAPILLRDGLLQFVSSADPRAQSKYGRSRKQWEIQNGDSYLIGSEAQESSQTRYRPQIEIFIPDASIASRHARLYVREGRFYIARHPDTAGTGALARYVLRVRGKTVVGSQELRDSDDILVGRTALTFVAKQSAH